MRASLAQAPLSASCKADATTIECARMCVSCVCCKRNAVSCRVHTLMSASKSCSTRYASISAARAVCADLVAMVMRMEGAANRDADPTVPLAASCESSLARETLVSSARSVRVVQCSAKKPTPAPASPPSRVVDELDPAPPGRNASFHRAFASPRHRAPVAPLSAPGRLCRSAAFPPLTRPLRGQISLSLSLNRTTTRKRTEKVAGKKLKKKSATAATGRWGRSARAARGRRGGRSGGRWGEV